MAVGAPTWRAKGDSTGSGNTVLSETFNVDDGDILIAIVFAGGNATAANNDISSVFSSGQSPTDGDFTTSSGWTILEQSQQSANPYFTGAIAWAIASESNAAATVTMQTAGLTSARWIEVIKVGANAATSQPTNYKVDATQTTTTTPTCTLPSTPASASNLICTYGWNDPAVGSSNAWVEATEELSENINGATNLLVSSYHVGGGNGDTFDPVPTVDAGGLVQQVLCMVEMTEAAASGENVPPRPPQRNRRRRGRRPQMVESN